MSRVQTNPDFFKQIKSLAAQVASLQRIALTTNSAVGDLIPSAAPSRPGGLLCDGTAYSRTTYATLFDAIGTAYGVGDGSTTFNVPDLRGRLPLGAGTGTGTGATAWSLGQQPTSGAGGEQSHVQTVGELATHNHTPPDGSNFWADSGGTVLPYGGTLQLYPFPTTGDTGSSNPMNILPPISVVNWFIIY